MRVLRLGGEEDLEGYRSVVAEVVREVHCGHAALAQLTVETVAVLQGRGEKLRRIGHERLWDGRGLRAAGPSCCPSAAPDTAVRNGLHPRQATGRFPLAGDVELLDPAFEVGPIDVRRPDPEQRRHILELPG